MKRLSLFFLLTACALVGGTLPSRAQDAAAVLPLKEVVLFSSGVGYFQRLGRVNGTASVELTFRADQVNDVLKSLVLFDPSGSVRPVSYALKDATTRRLATVGQSLGQDVSLGALLRQFQGARVRLETGGEVLEGRILSVSEKAVPVKDAGVVKTDVVNLLTEGGLRSVPLEGVSGVKLLDEKLDRELRSALELLARGLDDQSQKVELRFGGNQAREVRAGYLQETPVWKTSYRLVLDAEQKPYLQGWAIVENTTEEDWRDVRLSLVSGRPISFIQDLYQPLYVPRPVVEAQVIGSPQPQTYSEALESDRERVVGRKAAPPAGPAAAAPAPPAESNAARGAPGRAEELRRQVSISGELLAQSVAAQAEGTERGALFEYAIQQPVTIERAKAAMVPIVAGAVEGELLSLYDAAADPRRALNAFYLRNSTGLHLSGGPVTVFRDGVYAGDAQVTNVQPGDTRLLAYAVDLELVADRKEPKLRQDTVAVSAKSGVLLITRKQQQEVLYTFRNKSARPKTVLVQQPRTAEFKLAQPAQPLETTPDAYRFKVPVPAGQTGELRVVTERTLGETIALLDADVNVLIAYAQNTQVSEKLRGGLKQLVTLRRRVTELQTQRADLETEIRAIDQEQNRIRQNMAQLDRNSPLYQQYVKKLTDQEARIEKIRAETARLRAMELAAQEELRQFVDTLSSGAD